MSKSAGGLRSAPTNPLSTARQSTGGAEFAVKFAVPDSCWPITSGERADAFLSAFPASLKWEGSRKGEHGKQKS